MFEYGNKMQSLTLLSFAFPLGCILGDNQWPQQQGPLPVPLPNRPARPPPSTRHDRPPPPLRLDVRLHRARHLELRGARRRGADALSEDARHLPSDHAGVPARRRDGWGRVVLRWHRARSAAEIQSERYFFVSFIPSIMGQDNVIFTNRSIKNKMYS